MNTQAISNMNLTDDERRFVLHWGEMGAKWGISRAVAQIHALLMISSRPLHAQEISEVLNLARSNVSTGLRELEGWGLISVTHLLGDRRDYFQPIGDSWRTFITIVDKRVEREIQPTLEFLKGLSTQGKENSPAFQSRVKELVELLDAGLSFYKKLRKLPDIVLRKVLKFDSKLSKFLGGI